MRADEEDGAVGILDRAVARLPRYPRRRLAWRSLLAAPFAVSLLLTLRLGPATIDNAHASFAWLAVVSLTAVALLLFASDRLLIPLGLASILVFPLLAGLGFSFAPAWAGPIVAIVFYGSIASSAAAIITGIGAVLRPAVRRHPRALAIAAGSAGVLALGAVAIIVAGGNATVLASAPSMTVVNMGPVINTSQREAEPTFSADGRTMVFNCHDYDICVSHLTDTWQGGGWRSPQIVEAPISSAYMEVEPWLSPAGDKLYFNSNRPFASGDGLPGLELYVDVAGLIGGELGITPLGGVGQDEIWVSYLTDGRWSTPVDLNDAPGEPPVNTAYMDHCLAFSADGNEAFWTSTRPGGFGGNDIWTSRRVNGIWTAPENLGPKVNSAASEHHSMPSPDGQHMYVTSDRPGGYGGEDVYATTRGTDGGWGPLVNLASPINGPANDRCLTWTPDGAILLFDSDRPGSRGSKDLWWVYAKDVTVTGLTRATESRSGDVRS